MLTEQRLLIEILGVLWIEIDAVHLLDYDLDDLFAGRRLGLLSQHLAEDTPEDEVDALPRVDGIHVGAGRLGIGNQVQHVYQECGEIPLQP